jgi:hypothetical protein
MKVAVVGAPEYFAQRSPPLTPGDLARHSCVQYRQTAKGGVFKWSFERGGQARAISVAMRRWCALHCARRSEEMVVSSGDWRGLLRGLVCLVDCSSSI